MIHWRHEEDKKKRKSSCKDVAGPAPALSEQASAMPMRVRRQDSPQLWSEYPGRDGAQSQLGAKSTSLVSDSNATSLTGTGSSTWQFTASDTASYFPRWQQKTRTVTERDVIDYEASERHEERQLRNLVVGLARFYNVGGAQDPFDVLPQFRNPRLDALYLSRNCKCSYVISRDKPESFRYASVCLGRDNEEVAAADAVTSSHHPKRHRTSIDLARHAEQNFWRQYYNGHGQD